MIRPLPVAALALLFLLLCSTVGNTQSCVATGLNGSTINLPCGTNCGLVKVQVPHLKGSGDYALVSIPFTPLPYTGTTTLASAADLTRLYQDDNYSSLIPLTFPFCYYDSVYNTTVIGSNGLITFEAATANKPNSWPISNTIPYSSGTPPGSAATLYYPKAAIMPVFSDLDPETSTTNTSLNFSPRDRSIDWRIEGTAPCRKFVVSYYHIGAYNSVSHVCSMTTPATFQIVLYENTGLIDFFIENKSCLTTTNNDKAIMGIQNWQANKAVVIAGRNATSGWQAQNEGWRFVPSGAGSRFIRSELYDLTGTLLQTTSVPADTATTVPGLLDVKFPNVCITGTAQRYVIKTVYSTCPGPGEIFSLDTITVAKNFSVTTATTPSACGATGSIKVTLPAGAQPYTYQLNTATPITTLTSTYTFNNVAAGNYTITATNAAGCTTTLPVTVGSIGGLQVLSVPTATSCQGAANGSVTINPQNGTAPYQYSINGGAFQTSNTFPALAAGTYTFVIKDAGGCVLPGQTATVVAGPPVTATLATTNPTCNGSTGQVTAALSANATGPYQYSLDGVAYQATNTFTGIAAGTYTLYYKEASGCSGSKPFTISQPTAIVPTVAGQDVKCFGQASGQITASATGGTGAYTYSIDGTTFGASGSFAAAAGSYMVYVKDAAGCVATRPVTISQPAVLQPAAVTTNATCDGGADGLITASIAGGTSPYTFSTNGSSFGAANTFSVTSGSYTLTIKDANNCTATLPVTVGLTNNLTLAAAPDTTICEGTPAQLSVAANGTSYVWSPAATLSNATANNPVARPADTTQYVVTATLGVCSAKDSVTVNVTPAPIADAGGPTDEICFGQGYVLQGSGGVSYLWSPTTYFNAGSSATDQAPAITPATTTTYTLLVKDALGCQSLQPAAITLKVTPPIIVKVSPKDTVVAKGDVFQLRASSAATDYSWSPGAGLDNPSVQNPIATINQDETYTVTASTAAGCKGTATVVVKVYNGPEIYVPSGFTPNGDGRNDVLLPFPVGIKELHYFRVYNRWGQLIFQTTTLNRGWDGKLSGVVQAMGTYVWIAEGVTKENKVITRKGTATLIR